MICRDTNTKSGKMIDISKTRTSRTWRAVQRSYEMLASLRSETVIGHRIRRNYACSPLRAQFVGGKNDNKLLNVFNFTLGSCPICLTLNPPLVVFLRADFLPNVCAHAITVHAWERPVIVTVKRLYLNLNRTSKL